MIDFITGHWITGCLLSIALACATVRLNTCSFAWPVYQPGNDLGPVHEVRSSEFRRVCYKINILGSQLSPSNINLVPAQARKVTVGLASHWLSQTPWFIHLWLNGQRQGDEHPCPCSVAQFTLPYRITGVRVTTLTSSLQGFFWQTLGGPGPNWSNFRKIGWLMRN